MSHKDYSMFSKNKENKNNETVVSNDVNDVITTENAEPIVETIEQSPDEVTEVTAGLAQLVDVKTTATGFVDGCDRLNVRSGPSKDSEVACIIDKSTEVEIDLQSSTTDDFYKVKLSDGQEGYCMKKFIKIK